MVPKTGGDLHFNPQYPTAGTVQLTAQLVMWPRPYFWVLMHNLGLKAERGEERTIAMFYGLGFDKLSDTADPRGHTEREREDRAFDAPGSQDQRAVLYRSHAFVVIYYVLYSIVIPDGN